MGRSKKNKTVSDKKRLLIAAAVAVIAYPVLYFLFQYLPPKEFCFLEHICMNSGESPLLFPGFLIAGLTGLILLILFSVYMAFAILFSDKRRYFIGGFFLAIGVAALTLYIFIPADEKSQATHILVNGIIFTPLGLLTAFYRQLFALFKKK